VAKAATPPPASPQAAPAFVEVVPEPHAAKAPPLRATPATAPTRRKRFFF
jgi:hypothetical protein